MRFSIYKITSNACLARGYSPLCAIKDECDFKIVYCVPVRDWDLFEMMMDYTYNKHIKSESQLHPVLMSEPAVSKLVKSINCDLCTYKVIRHMVLVLSSFSHGSVIESTVYETD